MMKTVSDVWSLTINVFSLAHCGSDCGFLVDRHGALCFVSSQCL